MVQPSSLQARPGGGGGGALTTGVLVGGVPTVVDPIAPPALWDTQLVPAQPLARQAVVRGAACFIEPICTIPGDVTEFPRLVTLRLSRTLDFLARTHRRSLCKRQALAQCGGRPDLPAHALGYSGFAHGFGLQNSKN